MENRYSNGQLSWYLHSVIAENKLIRKGLVSKLAKRTAKGTAVLWLTKKKTVEYKVRPQTGNRAKPTKNGYQASQGEKAWMKAGGQQKQNIKVPAEELPTITYLLLSYGTIVIIARASEFTRNKMITGRPEIYIEHIIVKK